MAELFDKAETRGNRFLSPTSRTARLVEEARRYIPGGTSRIHYYFAPYPIYAQSGSGCRLTDVDGVERLDFLNNMTSLVHGHANPTINEAIVAQLAHGTAFSEPSEPEVRLAKLIVERVPSVQQIRFANSGTEAVMMAIKLARAFTGRHRIAKFEGFYHGYYDYVQVSFNSTPETWGSIDQPAAIASSGGLADSVTTEEVVVLPFNDRAAIERILAQHGSSLAAVIADPLSNRAGFPRPVEGFYDFLREITRSHGIVLIYDEVISFRIAYHGAQGKYGGEPDLTTFGKIIGGGLPIGAVGGSAEIMALLDPTSGAPAVLSGGTFSGNPLSMVAGLAAMEQMSPDEYERLNELGEQLRGRATAVFQAAGEPGQLVGDGSLFRMILTDEPIRDYRTTFGAQSRGKRMAEIHRNLLDEGVIISRDGLGCLSTPMGEGDVDFFVAALAKALR